MVEITGLVVLERLDREQVRHQGRQGVSDTELAEVADTVRDALIEAEKLP